MRRLKSSLWLAPMLLLVLGIWLLLPRAVIPAAPKPGASKAPGLVAKLQVMAIGHKSSVKMSRDCASCHR
ncbi:hypothetical protein EON81_07045 [bacterium]|nr:MAG: hypothetical protein EON81_07045 [bacterium]